MRWLPFVYQYVIMWIVMGTGLYLAVKSKNIDLKTAYGKKYFFILIGGMVGMMALQAFMQFVAPVI